MSTFANLFESALDAVASDVPEAYERFLEQTTGLPIALRIGTEEFGIVGGRVAVPTPNDCEVHLAVTPQVFAALVDGDVALTDALAAGGFDVTGRVADVARVDRAMRLLIHGIVRSPAAPDLIHQLRFLATHNPEPAVT